MLSYPAVRTAAQWVQTAGPDNGYVNCLFATDSTLFAGTDGGGIYVSRDAGTHWSATSSGIVVPYVNAIVMKGTSLFAATYSGVYQSSDNGASWRSVDSGLGTPAVLSLAVNGRVLFAGTYSGVSASTDNGASWSTTDSGLTSPTVLCLAARDTNLFAGTTNGVFVSHDNATTWVPADSGLTDPYIRSLVFLGSTLYAGTRSTGVFLSTDLGNSWVLVDNGLTNLNVYALAVSPATGGTGGTNLLVGTKGGGVFTSPDGGSNWADLNNGLDNAFVFALAANTTTVFAGTIGSGVWRRSSSNLTAAEFPGTPPTKFRLDQNYPNPFNPSTRIRFTIPKASRVKLSVYDLLGRQIAVLASEEMPTGTYERTWSPHVSSGVYFCKLESVPLADPFSPFSSVKRMLYIK
jgi:photosystem II stability/assembly factor-like uncharacterized protein